MCTAAIANFPKKPTTVGLVSFAYAFKQSLFKPKITIKTTSLIISLPSARNKQNFVSLALLTIKRIKMRMVASLASQCMGNMILAKKSCHNNYID